MSITYPLDVPLEEFSEVEVQGVDINNLQVSTFTGEDRVQEFDGDYWRINLRYRNLPAELFRPVSAFVMALRKSVGTFVVSFPGYSQPRGNARNEPVTPLVDGNDQAGNRTLQVKNTTPSVSDWLLSGDIIQVGPDTRPRWHMVLADVDTAADGTASIDVWPSLRRETTNDDTIVLDNPKGICRLTGNVAMPIRPPVLVDLSLECREAIRLAT